MGRSPTFTVVRAAGRGGQAAPRAATPGATALPWENLGVGPAPPLRPSPPPPQAERAPLAAGPDNPLRLYREAYEQLRAGKNDAAERGFREFVRRYPQHDYAD